jgi:hypothetical protein
MKFLPLFMGSLLFILSACNQGGANQNAVQTPVPATQPAPAVEQKAVDTTPATIDQTLLTQQTARAKANLAGFKSLLKQLDVLPATVRQNNTATVEGMKNELSSMIAKAQYLVDELDKISKLAKAPQGGESEMGSPTIRAAAKQLQNNISDLDRNSEDLKNFGDAIKKLK